MRYRFLLRVMGIVAIVWWHFAAVQAQDRPYHWETVPFGGGGYVPGFVYHPKQPNLLYARTDVGGMYRYDFAAGHWVQLLDHLGRDEGDLSGVLSIALDPNDPNKVYAACGMYLGKWARKGAILRSNDQGRTWQKTELPIHIGGNSDGRGMGERLAVDPRNGKIIYFGSNEDGLWKSTDGGETFGKISSPITSYSLVAFDPKTSDMYVGSVDGEGGLWESRDAGLTFARVLGTPPQVPQHMAFGRDGSVYVAYAQAKDNKALNPSNADNGSVWKRDAAGQWSEVTPARPTKDWRFGYSGIDVGPDGTVITSTLDRWAGGDDVYLSRDGGAHWIGLKDKSHHDQTTYPWLADFTRGAEQMGSWNSDIKINPFNKNEAIYVGPWVSRNLSDAGTGKPVEWDFKTKDLEETCIMQLVSPLRGPRVMAAMGDDAGAAWYDITKPPFEAIFHPARETNRSVDYAAGQPDFIARTSDAGPSYGYISENGGRSWTPFPSSPYKAPADGHDWRSPGVLAVSANATSIVWVPERENAYYSADKGKTWQKSAGWPLSGQTRQLEVISDKGADAAFYVFDPTGNIYASFDGGVNFQVIVSGLPKIDPWQQAQLAVVPGRVRDLWLAAPYGLIHSPDFNADTTKLRAVTAAWAIGFGAPLKPGAYPAVYMWGQVKKQEGIWRSDDEGQSWIRINDDAHQFGGMLLTGDMREPGAVYVAAGARGLKIGRPAD